MIRSGRYVVIPDLVQVRVIAPASAAIPWWLAGGISAASCVAAYQAIGAASLADSYVNLANPGTYDAAPGVAPSWAAASGWSFNGSSTYLALGGLTVGDGWSMFCRFSDVPSPGTASQSAIGGRNAYSYSSIQPSYTGGGAYIEHESYRAQTPAASGIWGFSNLQAYINGVAAGAPMSSRAEAYDALNIGRYSSGTACWFGGKIQAIAIYNATLTADQVSALTTAMNALTG